MNARKFNSTISQMQKHCTYLNNNDVCCAVLYFTNNGLLKTFGSGQILDKFETVANDIVRDLDQETMSMSEKIIIPLLNRPLREMSVMDCRTTIPQLMKTCNPGYHGWGKEGRKPVWWPQNVLFRNPKQRPSTFVGKSNALSCFESIYIM